MKYRPNLLLLTAMILCMGSFITNRFIIPVPDPVTIAILLVSVGLFAVYIIKSRRDKK
ncbi:MAG: hypothetical protein FWH00_02590 [Oscillospiraceae bacterium]|nr:hypothetical protein [Oscillospiraceae bacterium]